jgi:hypothetical protein
MAAAMVFGQSTTDLSNTQNNQNTTIGVATPTTNSPNTQVGVAPAVPANGPYLVQTPSMQLGQVNLQSGASNATSGNSAGASNSTLLAPGNNPTMPQVPSAYNSFDLGAGSAMGSSGSGESLAQASRDAIARRQTDHPRVFTNEDIARLHGEAANNAPAGNGAPVTNQNTMPSSDVTAPQGATQPGVPPTYSNPQATPQTAAPPAPIRSPFRPKSQPQQQPTQPQTPPPQ